MRYNPPFMPPSSPITAYIRGIDKIFRTGSATEHSYRGALETLLRDLLPGVTVINEPGLTEVGAPDYRLQSKNGGTIGCIEAKNIGDPDLHGSSKNKAQFDRYKSGIPNIAFTDYLRFAFYSSGEQIGEFQIARESGGGIVPAKKDHAEFTAFLQTRFADTGEYGISDAQQLAKIMAGKTRLLADIIVRTLAAGDSTLSNQLEVFRKRLIPTLSQNDFADIYAQTIAYGMLTARQQLGAEDNDFTRERAAAAIPPTSPFIRHLFDHIAGIDIDPRIVWIVDDLAAIFNACDLEKILHIYGSRAQAKQPFMHFYETFLSAYDPAQRKKRGVWYTPEPVVRFIVRSVHDILQKEFGLAQGLADSSQTTVTIRRGADKYKKQFHRVQILDPAAGTGVFLAEIVECIHEQMKAQQGGWADYARQHLLPRINGFEILMASYAMAHLQLDLLLQRTGYTPSAGQNPPRLRVYLTDSMVKHDPDTSTLFAEWLSDEAKEANEVKRDAPVMCVIGNPPYSGISQNKGKWITDLIETYKYVDGKHFNEKKHWLHDDYVKFLRYGQHFIEKNGSGILAFINPHGFLDNPTFRGMRWNLLRAYDKIYVLDLHGNAKKKETAPDGGKDENVFNIQQGVSINLLIKTGEKNPGALAEVWHGDLYGRREEKYDFLRDNTVSSVKYTRLAPQAPMYFMVPKNYAAQTDYEKGFSISGLFVSYASGIVTGIDRLSIFYTAQECADITDRILGAADPYAEFGIRDARKASKEERLAELREARKNPPVQIAYRPFDMRYMYRTVNSEHWINSPRDEIMRHFLMGENLGLVTIRRSRKGNDKWNEVFVTDSIISGSTAITALDINYLFPLYLYPEAGDMHAGETRTPNLDAAIVQKIAAAIGLPFAAEEQADNSSFAPVDILDYIYAVLHSPAYRAKYGEFLKTDFPRIPYPSGEKEFRRLAALGGELRQLHLPQNPASAELITEYPQSGDNVVRKPQYKDGRVYISETQYFGKVPLSAWEFYIGGYQPAQKWLKDRKGRMLGYDDQQHYQRIIACLMETARLMEEIDDIFTP